MATPTHNRICINCKHYQATVTVGGARRAITRNMCHANRHHIDGRTIVLECETARSARTGRCGPTGKMFEPAPVAGVANVSVTMNGPASGGSIHPEAVTERAVRRSRERSNV